MVGESAVSNHTTWIVSGSIPVFGDSLNRNNALWKKAKPWPWEERRGAVLNFLQLEFPVPVGADVRRLIKYCQTVNFSNI